jgi:hypothetical protein
VLNQLKRVSSVSPGSDPEKVGRAPRSVASRRRLLIHRPRIVENPRQSQRNLRQTRTGLSGQAAGGGYTDPSLAKSVHTLGADPGATPR